MRKLSLLLAIILIPTLATAQRTLGIETSNQVSTGERVALVIGNAAYTDAPLKNPANDATDMAAALRDCGFEVILRTDANLRSFEQSIDEFGKRIRGSEAALFYYAGHGVQAEGENYLIPVGATVDGENELRYLAVNAGRVFAKMESAGTEVNIMILDACRNNPFVRSWRSSLKGLAVMDAPKGSIISFATQAGSVAADGDGRNGLYTGSLLRYIRAPGLDLRDVFMQTRRDVLSATDDKQVPWENSSLVGTFYFMEAESPAEPTRVANTTNALEKTTPAPPALVMTGNLQVNVNAPDAQVSVNGKPVGTATPSKALNVQNLPTGNAVVTVIADGFETFTRTVTIERNQWEQVVAQMGRVEVEIEVAVLPPAPPPKKPEPSPKKPEPSPKKQENGSRFKAGKVRTFDDIEFVWIPPGMFSMGSPGNEKQRGDDETQHGVTISRGFWMARYEVTQAQWKRVMGSNPSEFKGDDTPGENVRSQEKKVSDPSSFKGNDNRFRPRSRTPKGSDASSDDKPVEKVSWDDAQSYLQKLNGSSSGAYRLPTEAEWEYACRAGTTTPFHFGKSLSSDQANFNKTDLKKTTTVGNFRPNAWGLYDMHGNVSEWCQDGYGEYPSGNATDPTGIPSGSSRVLRGGGSLNDAADCRSATRSEAPATRLGNTIGFRIVRPQE